MRAKASLTRSVAARATPNNTPRRAQCDATTGWLLADSQTGRQTGRRRKSCTLVWCWCCIARCIFDGSSHCTKRAPTVERRSDGRVASGHQDSVRSATCNDGAGRTGIANRWAARRATQIFLLFASRGGSLNPERRSEGHAAR